MHARGGFEQEGFLQLSWSVVVDIVCVWMIVWIASGLFMWWELPGPATMGMGGDPRRHGLLRVLHAAAVSALPNPAANPPANQ